MKIGLIVPSLNSANSVEGALDSVLFQEGDFELRIHVQDGGSEDNTVNLVEQKIATLEAGKNSPRLSVASSSDSGAAEALNRGFKEIDADILGWLGSDDILFPGALHAVSSYVEQTGANWVTGLPTVIDTEGRIVSLRRTRSPHRYPTGFSRALLARGFHSNGLVGGIQQEGTFWTRSLWEKSGGYIDENLTVAFDFELWCRMARHSEIVQLVHPLAAFRVRPGQLSSNVGLYRDEVKAVRRQLPSTSRSSSNGINLRHYQRPVAYLPPGSATWVTKRHTVSGRPFSRLGEKIANVLGQGK